MLLWGGCRGGCGAWILKLNRHLKDNQDDSIEDRKGVEGKGRNGVRPLFDIP